MRGEQNVRLTLIERYGEGLGALTGQDFDLDAEQDDRLEDFLGLLQKESQHVRELIEASAPDFISEVMASSKEVDPEDKATELLWRAMQSFKSSYQQIELWMSILRQRGEYLYSMAVVTRENMLRSFDLINDVRTVILEHDADVSGFQGKSYESVDALMAALEGKE